MNERQRTIKINYWAAMTPEERKARGAAISAGLKRAWAWGKANPPSSPWQMLSEEERKKRLLERNEALSAGRQGMGRSAGMFGWAPPEDLFDMYQDLRKKFGAEEACRLVKDHMVVAERRKAK